MRKVQQLLKPRIQSFPGSSVVKICSQMQETRVQSLDQEDPTCHRAAKPMHHNYRACAQSLGAPATEFTCHNYWSPCALQACSAAREATATRSPYPEMNSSPCSPYEEKSPCSNRDPAQPKINKYIKLQRKTKQNKTKKQSWGCLLTVVSCQLVY